MRNNNVAIFLINLNNAEFHCFTNKYIVVANGLNINLRTREECFSAEHVNNHTTLSLALDEALNDFLFLKGFVNAIPTTGSTSLLVRENELTILVFLVFDVNLNLVANLEIRIIAELSCRHDTVGLVANTDYNVTFVDSLNCTFHYFACLDGVECFVVLIDQFFVLFALSLSFKSIPVEVLE